MSTVTASMPATINLQVYHGDSWAQQFRFLTDTVPVDLTGVTLEAAARGSDGTAVDLVATVVGDPLDGTIVLQPPAGGLDPDTYDYDIEVTDAGVITTWVRGHLQLVQDVTP